jgi:hypothetical protein
MDVEEDCCVLNLKLYPSTKLGEMKQQHKHQTGEPIYGLRFNVYVEGHYVFI